MAEPWPAELQDFVNRDSFQYVFGETTVRSDMEVGPAKVRRRFTKSVDQIQFSFVLPKTNWSLFYNFYYTTLNGGVTPFLFTSPVSGVEEQWRIKSSPSIVPFGYDNFTVSMQVERMP